LLFAPSHHYIASNFNANTVQLSLWPWAAFFFVRSLQTNSWKDGVFFGALGGCALLGKYYSILFLISCFVAALLHPNRRSYFRSAAPYCAVVTCAVFFAPHAWWAWENGLRTVHYALSKSQRPAWQNTYSAVGTAVAGVAANAAGTVILLGALGPRWRVLLSSPPSCSVWWVTLRSRRTSSSRPFACCRCLCATRWAQRWRALVRGASPAGPQHSCCSRSRYRPSLPIRPLLFVSMR